MFKFIICIIYCTPVLLFVVHSISLSSVESIALFTVQSRPNMVNYVSLSLCALKEEIVLRGEIVIDPEFVNVYLSHHILSYGVPCTDNQLMISR